MEGEMMKESEFEFDDDIFGESSCKESRVEEAYKPKQCDPEIDNVGNPSWQAQIKGTKKWTLEPPPECSLVCDPKLEVTVHPGEIIVFDTNKWFHQTDIMGKELSITIGSEYD
ncbi:uncharacterized protein [Montipora foliosa]|uniref:uncharacterized protein n=1 Tax=Montipora foliosa TaxID=591990 RepID=UPI0035F10B52